MAVSSGWTIAQSDSTKKIKLDPIEISLITNYYEQDGIHSPVTGGTGTEQLSNIAPSVYVHIPMMNDRALDVNAGVDYYTSASSDNIDNPYLNSNHISGASAADIRQYYTITYSKKNKEKQNGVKYLIGASSEYDVTSLSAGIGFDKQNKKKGREWSINAKYFFDDWKLIYPVELRNGATQLLAQDKRHTVGLTFAESFIINKRWQGSITLDGLGQFGRLSTPFHRVYMPGEDIARIEQLPELRIKVPIGLRLNGFIGNSFILRTFNRVYWDSWDIKSYTGEIETVFKGKDWFRIYPFYRFHFQTQARYFAPFRGHSLADTYYTADYDLSGFTAHKIGLGTQFTPLHGFLRMKAGSGRIFTWKAIDFRGTYYLRSDGLKAWAVTFGFDFKIENREKTVKVKE